MRVRRFVASDADRLWALSTLPNVGEAADPTVSLGFQLLHLDTATNQPQAIAFYKAIGYTPAGTESRPDWTWTLQYFAKAL